MTRCSSQRTLFLMIAVPALVVLLTAAAHAQPANNNCADAIEVFADIPVNGSNVGATGTNLSSCAGTGDVNDVWYFFVAPDNGLATFSLCGGATWDTTLAIFASCGGVELACDDDGCGNLRSTATISAASGNVYYARIAGFGGASGSFTMTVTFVEGGAVSGPDVTYSNIQGITNWGAVGGIRGYSLGSWTCNIGDVNLPWNSTQPLLGMNAYRLHDGRLVQLGMSWLKNATVAAASSGCGLTCNGQGGSVLGAGCRDVYSPSYNGGQGILGPRSQCNAYTGQYPGPSGGSGNAIYKRLQIRQTDLTASLFPNSLYFAEGVYVASSDAAAGNALNNASYKRFTVDQSTFALTPVGDMQVGVPAIYAWRDHGLGLGVPDPSVEVITADVPGEGRFFVASKVMPMGGGIWRYEYAIFNLNSHRSAGSFRVPIAPGTVVSNIGFFDVDYHSGEPFDNTDWNSSIGALDVTWSSPQTFAQNPNSNALRFGTMYNFWFDATTGPKVEDAEIGLFRTGSPDSISVALRVPAGCAGDCYADGQRDALDVQAYVDCLLGSGKDCTCADFSALGGADLADLPSFVDVLLQESDCP